MEREPCVVLHDSIKGKYCHVSIKFNEGFSRYSVLCFPQWVLVQERRYILSFKLGSCCLRVLIMSIII